MRRIKDLIRGLAYLVSFPFLAFVVVIYWVVISTRTGLREDGQEKESQTSKAR